LIKRLHSYSVRLNISQIEFVLIIKLPNYEKEINLLRMEKASYEINSWNYSSCKLTNHIFIEVFVSKKTQILRKSTKINAVIRKLN
jgi:hypothetical protein